MTTASAADTLRFPAGVYGVTPDWRDTARLLDAVRAAAAGGMTALQWRRKHLTDPAARLEEAAALASLCRSLGVVYLINDDWRLALAVQADGVHLGRDDGDVAPAREALGPHRLIGRSCYDQPALAAQALADGADYVAFGAMYPSSVKPDAVRAMPAHVAAGRTQVAAWPAPRPAVVAIGGITPDNAAAVVAAGADSLAMISGLFDAPNIEAAAARCTALFTQPSA